jgi:hypothetical protein
MRIPESIKEIEVGAFGGAKIDFLDLSEYCALANLPLREQLDAIRLLFSRKDLFGHRVMLPKSSGSVVRLPGRKEYTLNVRKVNEWQWEPNSEALPEGGPQ